MRSIHPRSLITEPSKGHSFSLVRPAVDLDLQVVILIIQTIPMAVQTHILSHFLPGIDQLAFICLPAM
jgi:hypothetical protein